MALVDRLWLATVTNGGNDAGTDAGRLNVTINVNGEDLLDQDFTFMQGTGFLSGGFGPDSGWLDEHQAALSDNTLTTPIESTLLTNSSIRVGIRSDDMWGPRHALVLGNSERRVIALAMETELGSLSTDTSEGKLTMPLRLVGEGSSSTVIRRVMFLVYTHSGSDIQTDSPIQLQIAAGGSIVFQQLIFDTDQDDFEQYTANWHIFDAPVPFTRGDVLSNGGISLSILGTDAWLPKRLFVYGLDTAAGRPNEVVHLVSVPEWNFGTMSTDLSEGQPSIALPVI